MRRVAVSLCFFFVLCSLSPTTFANDRSHPVTFTIVSVPGLTFNHLESAELSFLQQCLRADSALGAMNLRTAGSDSLANSYATLGSGRRVVVPHAESFYEIGEDYKGRPVSSWVRERIGIQPYRGAVYPSLIPYFDEHHKKTLGDVIRRSGMNTAVWGNADWEDEAARFAPFLTMDRHGHTAEAVINDEVLMRADGFPYGLRTNYDHLLKQIEVSAAEFRVVELGDLFRLQREAAFMTQRRFDKLEHQILQDIDDFLLRLTSRLTSRDVLWLISPYVEQEDMKKQSELAPVIWIERGKTGLLHSPTTRRSGIVANVDLAPTVLHTLGMDIPDTMDGQPVHVTDGDIEAFWAMLDQVKTVFRLRPAVIYTYALYQVTVLIIALGVLVSKKRRRTTLLQMALLASMLTPVLFLLLSPVPAYSPQWFLMLWAGLAIFFAFLLKKLPTLPLFFVIGFVGFVPVIVDGLLGGYFIQRSFLGFDAINGARYYGIGNEYMGVVIGAVILTVAASLEWWRPRAGWIKAGTALLFVFLILYFAAPFWGTNAGGALAASVGFGVAYARFFHTNSEGHFWIAFAALGVGGFGVLFVMNVLFAVDAPSHIGRAFDHLLAGNFTEIIEIASRKLSTNIRLIKGSLWGRVFFISLLAMAVLIVQPLRGVRWLQMRYPYLYHGFTAIVVAALSALAVNDSGIVSAATAIVYVVIPLLIIVCRDWTLKPEDFPTK